MMVILHEEKADELINLSSLDVFNVFINEKWNIIICLVLFH